jgi:tRNA pseudouridine13 synthase
MTIKQSPADFAVEELLAAAARGAILAAPAANVLYRLTKENLTTPAAEALVARALGVRPGEVAHAGLKDRHARTVQHISVHMEAAANAPETAAGSGWQIERLGWVRAAITAEAILANRFTITVRGLTRQACSEMDEAVTILRQPDIGGDNPPLPRRAQNDSTLLFVNYFGEQRFGSARHGQGFLAKHLVRGEFEEALRLVLATWDRKETRGQKEAKRAAAAGWGRWTELAEKLPRSPDRRAVEHLARYPTDFAGAFAALPYDDQEMAVQAYQSYLWNEIARLFVEEHCASGGAGLRREEKFGDLFFPAAAAVPAEVARLVLPVLGQGTVPAEPWKAAAETILARESITTADLRVPGLRRPRFGEAARPLFVAAAGFAMSAPEPEASAAAPVPSKHPKATPPAARFSRILQFDLPRGAYATVLLRALGQ